MSPKAMSYPQGSSQRSFLCHVGVASLLIYVTYIIMMSFIVFPEVQRDCVFIVFNSAVPEAFYGEPEIN